MLNRDSEIDDIFVRTCDKNLTLGSVVPLAMFLYIFALSRLDSIFLLFCFQNPSLTSCTGTAASHQYQDKNNQTELLHCFCIFFLTILASTKYIVQTVYRVSLFSIADSEDSQPSINY